MPTLPDQIKRLLSHEDLTTYELAQRLNQPLANMRRVTALMSGLETDSKHKPLPKEIEINLDNKKWRLVQRAKP